MIYHENRLPADDSHEISCLICYFWNSGKIWNCHLLQIIGGALRVNCRLNVNCNYPVYLPGSSPFVATCLLFCIIVAFLVVCWFCKQFRSKYKLVDTDCVPERNYFKNWLKKSTNYKKSLKLLWGFSIWISMQPRLYLDSPLGQFEICLVFLSLITNLGTHNASRSVCVYFSSPITTQDRRQ